MKRVLVVGISGTGKTLLASQLSNKLNLPAINLDSIFWKPNWTEEDEDIVKEKVRKEITKKEWIIEGYIKPLGKERVMAADKVIYLDYSGIVALWGGLRRGLKHRHQPRQEMPAGNTDSLGLKFLLTLLRRDERPEIEAAISGSADKIVRFKTRRELKKYLKELSKI